MPTDPITQLSAAFSRITEALESHKTHQGSLTSAKEAQLRASEAFTAAETKTADVQATVTTEKESVVEAIDLATTSLSAVKALYTG